VLINSDCGAGTMRGSMHSLLAVIGRECRDIADSPSTASSETISRRQPSRSLGFQNMRALRLETGVREAEGGE